jgi:hypothetical protein
MIEVSVPECGIEGQAEVLAIHDDDVYFCSETRTISWSLRMIT